ncbi:hypothetical protein GQ602_004611 [Ophiocordyceps camponoti-floridani]|uniref:Uncharacterized protein n=1 Tax=Ophiocordyceps camponoti-floridani TaxID=2030778 RepID=A0A8H4VDY2_9HYPO|nr:hypothetical protein GQ602_004611 [Ophiocordyceps camponoti-floridani]
MRATTILALTGVVVAFEPNKGPECQLVCRNRVPREHCPSFHYVKGEMKTCAHSQWGCTDQDRKDCGETVTPPPLCVVNGPCYAGPTGCLEDKTGADDGLPPGTYVGHCPAPKSQLQRCTECHDGCAKMKPGRGAAFQACLSLRCRRQCHGGILYKVQYFEARKHCSEQGKEMGDNEFQVCVKKELNGTVPENSRCLMQYTDSEKYCEELKYTRGGLEFQGCIKKLFDGVCSDEFRCTPQFRDARKYCNKQKYVIGGPEHQKCIADLLTDVCPKDVGCKKRHTDAREYCKKDNKFGGPEFQECVAKMLDPTCPHDFQCPQRKKDAGQWCKSKGEKEGSPEMEACVKEALKGLCPESGSGMVDGFLPQEQTEL